MKIVAVWRSLLADRSGNIALIFGLCAVVVIAAAGGAIDYLRLAKERTAMQEAADAAALAAVKLRKAPESERNAAANQIFAQNYRMAGEDSPSPLHIAYAGDTATVTATRVVPTTLLGVIGKRSFNTVVTSEATTAWSSPVCMLALDAGHANGFEVYGNAALTGNNCAVVSNSGDDKGMRTYGGAQARAAQFGVVGGYNGDFDPVPETGIAPLPDPYADLRLPALGACAAASGRLKESAALNPGTYCDGLEIMAGATVRLNPGLYIMKDGPFKVQSGAAVSGDDVTIAFTGPKATLYLQGGGTLRLTAPTKGDFAGIVLFSESTSPEVELATISGGATLNYVGTLYLPTHELWVKSPAAERAVLKAETSSYGVIARRVWVQGNAELEVTRIDPDADSDSLRFKYGSRLVQ